MRVLSLVLLAGALFGEDRVEKAAQALSKVSDPGTPVIVVAFEGNATVIHLPSAAAEEFMKYGAANGFGEGFGDVIRSLLGTFRSSIAVQPGGKLEAQKATADRATAVAQSAQEELRQKADALRAEIK